MTQTANGLDIGQIFEQVSSRRPSTILGLNFNPFPPTGITGSGVFPSGFYLVPSHHDQLSEFVRRSLGENDFCGLVILGEYGAGKTALLKYFEGQVSRAQGQGHPVAAYYVSNPGTSFADVLQSMVRAIGRDVLQKYAWAFFLVQLKEGVKENNTFLEEIGLVQLPTEGLTQIADGHEFWRQFHDGLKVEPKTISHAVTSVMREKLPDDALAEELAALMLGDRSTASQSWSRLIRPLPSTSSRKPAPGDRLDSLLMVLRANGINHVFLLIDEFEDVVFQRMTKRLRDDFTATLRLLISEHGHNFSIVFGSNLPGWSQMLRSDPGLSDRFNLKIQLEELHGTDIRGIVARYIGLAKTEESNSADEFFSDQTLSKIEERSITLARPLLALLHNLTERYWEEAKLPSSDEIESFLEGGS